MNTAQKEPKLSLPIFGNRSSKRDQVIAIDLGSRTTKAVHVQRTGERLSLVRYAIQDAPIYEKAASPDLLGEHLRAIVQQLETKTKLVTLVASSADSILRHAEVPQMPRAEIRMMLKFNTKTYLQQELPDHVFDCFVLPSTVEVKPEAGNTLKHKVWVGGARSEYVNDLQRAARLAGLVPDQVTLSALGPINAFEKAHPESFQREIVALVDIGFKSTTINVLMYGELALNRVVALGGDRITTGLSEALAISYAEAEGIKIGMPTEVESSLLPLLLPLGRELRASMDFFEHQHEKVISQVFVSGGGGRSSFLIQNLQSELLVPCATWNPASSFVSALPPHQAGELEQLSPQLAVALSAAASSL